MAKLLISGLLCVVQSTIVQAQITDAERALLQNSAEQGDGFAQALLGLMYAQGDGVPRDSAEAAKWFQKAIDERVFGYFDIGLMYDKGDGVPKDLAEAAKWYRRAAEQGHAQSQYNLGVMYYSGEGVTRDYAEAARWFRRAAEQGHAQAQYNLGVMYRYGSGFPKDTAEAAEWFRRAAEQGTADAKYELGMMYLEGQGLPRNFVIAYMWLNLAAAQAQNVEVFRGGNSPENAQILPIEQFAGLVRDFIEKNMTPEQIAEAQRLSREWIQSIKP